MPDIEKGICRIHYLSASPKEVIQVLDVLIKVSRAITNGSSFESSLLNRLFDILPTIHDKVVQFRDAVNVDFKDKTDFFKAESKYPDIPQQKKNIVFVENEIIEHLKEVKTATQIHDLKYVSVSNIDVRILEFTVDPSDSH